MRLTGLLLSIIGICLLLWQDGVERRSGRRSRRLDWGARILVLVGVALQTWAYFGGEGRP